MGFWVCQFSLEMEMCPSLVEIEALSIFTLRTRGISAAGSLKNVDFGRLEDSFFNETRNFILPGRMDFGKIQKISFFRRRVWTREFDRLFFSRV
ncbi:unnamed protein product [Rhizophagus irregularis]|nr:unnamed protein product [Rhizophagus irregularis]